MALLQALCLLALLLSPVESTSRWRPTHDFIELNVPLPFSRHRGLRSPLQPVDVLNPTSFDDRSGSATDRSFRKTADNPGQQDPANSLGTAKAVNGLTSAASSSINGTKAVGSTAAGGLKEGVSASIDGIKAIMSGVFNVTEFGLRSAGGLVTSVTDPVFGSMRDKNSVIGGLLPPEPPKEVQKPPVPPMPPMDWSEKRDKLTTDVFEAPNFEARVRSSVAGQLESSTPFPVKQSGFAPVATEVDGQSTRFVLSPMEGAEVILIDAQNQGTLESSYVSIGKEMQTLEQSYLGCLGRFSDLDFSRANVEKCIGHRMAFVRNDLDYLDRQILARFDSMVQALVRDDCFSVDQNDLVLAAGCNWVLKDALQLLWSGMNYHLTLQYHRPKYTGQVAQLSEDLFRALMASLKDLYAQQVQLRTELSNHQRILQVKVEDYVRRRVDDIDADIAANGPLKPGRLSVRSSPSVQVQQRLEELELIRETSKWGGPFEDFYDRSERALNPFHNPWTGTVPGDGRKSSKSTRRAANSRTARSRAYKPLRDLV